MKPLSWSEVRALIACNACVLMLRTRGVRCIRHTRDSERPARAKAIGVVR